MGSGTLRRTKKNLASSPCRLTVTTKSKYLKPAHTAAGLATKAKAKGIPSSGMKVNDNKKGCVDTAGVWIIQESSKNTEFRTEMKTTSGSLICCRRQQRAYSNRHRKAGDCFCRAKTVSNISPRTRRTRHLIPRYSPRRLHWPGEQLIRLCFLEAFEENWLLMQG